MSLWHGAKARRAAGAAFAAVALSVSLTACGGSDGGDNKEQSASASASAPGDAKPQESGGPTVPDTSKTLVTINGSNGFQFLIHTADRDEGGFLTVNGTIKNTSGKRQAPRIDWGGQETQIRKTGRSLGGITLVDKAEKKRYYVLRDTDGYPLTTTGIDAFDADESVTFFAQFPAPSASTSQVDIQIPGAPTATIEIS
ncbi:hypothetical protein OIE62_27165 [Streptomyces scopuliridis]|uniref:Uncharacterized protein n=1 Tax=Streptomyces scopuliridis TaxID=452529 RepID=A0ACD4ZIH8_9ACTN|nr:hypothetical protein [Streptomyces scopuliridis]WSB97984.1 hypothetical protein OG835_13775 [Streptomyces scopuliridis]WSC08314.1 hypothetical protein OIE62_27165 [Streptomyces scopuliridis]